MKSLVTLGLLMIAATASAATTVVESAREIGPGNRGQSGPNVGVLDSQMPCAAAHRGNDDVAVLLGQSGQTGIADDLLRVAAQAVQGYDQWSPFVLLVAGGDE